MPELGPVYGVVVSVVLVLCVLGGFGGRWSLLCRLAYPLVMGLGCMGSSCADSVSNGGICRDLKSVTSFWPRSIPTMGHRPPLVS